MRAISGVLKTGVLVGVVAVPRLASAHCPLCTAGAGVLAVGAAWLGISSLVVGILIGAFAYALAVWTARLVKRRYIPYQSAIIGTAVFLGTVLPVMPLVREYVPLYISVMGEYGAFLHNTYSVNLFIVGVPLGAVVVYLAPGISAAITARRGRSIPFQGVLLTLGMLFVLSIIGELLL